jgi:hypothetical protein
MAMLYAKVYFDDHRCVRPCTVEVLWTEGERDRDVADAAWNALADYMDLDEAASLIASAPYFDEEVREGELARMKEVLAEKLREEELTLRLMRTTYRIPSEP